MQEMKCTVAHVRQLNDFVYQVWLKPDEPVAFYAGQYLMVVMGAGDLRPFSIASLPEQPELLELHIGAVPENPYAWEVLTQIREAGELTVQVPGGEACYRSTAAEPLILIAGGTGFSYTWSILREHLKQPDPTPITLYWGGRELTDLYLHREVQELAARHPEFTYRPVLEQPPADWQGARGLVHHAVLQEVAQLSRHRIYVAGRFEMVRVVRDDLALRNFPADQLHGDALSFI